MKRVLRYIEEHNRIIWITMTIVLCIIAALQYCSRLNWNTSFTNDEFQSASVAINFASGKGLIRTDSLRIDQVAGQTWSSYTRGWPATVLLAGWIKLFGSSEIACRSLSSVYGVLSVLSVIYITYKMFKNLGYSFLTSLLFIAEPVCGAYFALCRMYSLEILGCIWLYYCVYQSLTKGNPWKKNGDCSKIRKLCRESFDFHWGYVIASLILILLCFETHVNSAIPLGGAACYVVVEAIRSRKAKFITLTGIGTVGGIVCLANYLAYRIFGEFFMMSYVFGRFVYYAASINVQWDYLLYILGVTGAIAISIIAFLIIVIDGIKKRQLDSKITYLMCLIIFTIVFFVLFSTGRYTYTARYIVALVPIAIAFFVYAYSLLKRWNRYIAVIVFTGMTIFTSWSMGKDIYLRLVIGNVNNTDFATAYSKINEYYDLETELVPVVESFIRTYYSDKVLNDFVYVAMDRKLDFDRWKDFAKEYPEGIVMVEQIKMSPLKQGVPQIIQNWTDRLSGPGIDKTYVNVSHYNFLYECGDEVDIEAESMLYNDELSNFGCYFDGKIVWLSVQSKILVQENAPVNPEVLFIDILFDTTDGNVQRYYQLVLPEDYGEKEQYIYQIDINQMRNIDAKSITGAVVDSSKMAIYGNDYIQEYYY